MSTARREILPFLGAMTHHCKNRELTIAMTAKYDLDAEHVSFVTGSGEDTNKVQKIVDDAEQLREEAAVEHSGGAFEGSFGSPESDGEAAARSNESLGGDGDSGDASDSKARNGDSNDSEAADTSPDDDDDDAQSGLADFA